MDAAMPLSSDLNHERHYPTILIVDDDSHFRRLLNIIMTDAGHRVLEADSGRAALELLRNTTDVIDLILCDVRMPEMDGVETVTLFRRDFPAIPVAVLTGFADSEIAAGLIEKGVSDFTAKPIELEKVLTVVQRILARPITLKS
jgi:two-component system, chemotaxis family, chemotaxis protein CheY